MNLIPANSLLQVICGDIKFLPGAAMWLPLTMADGEELHLSQGDMSAAFYTYLSCQLCGNSSWPSTSS
jgi:hypothetical protein